MALGADKICCGLCANKTKFAKDRNCVQYNSKYESYTVHLTKRGKNENV